jgi:methanethiol S-methyltransferase
MQENEPKTRGWENPVAKFFVGFISIVVYAYLMFVIVFLTVWLIDVQNFYPDEKLITKVFPSGIDHPSNTSIMESFFESVPIAPKEWQPWIWNFLVLSIWTGHHSLFARPMMKELLGEASRGEVSINRSFYCAVAAVILHVLLLSW